MDVLELKQEFMALCRPLSDRPGVLYAQFEEERKTCSFTMLLRAIKVQLVYCWKWESVAPPSVLYCRFYLNKNVPLYLHLPELICILEEQDFRACYFPCIESAQRMRDCFSALLGIVDDYIPRADALVRSGQAEKIMERRFQIDFWGNRMDDPKGESHWSYGDPEDRAIMHALDRLSESVMVERFSSLNAYVDFLTGDWEKALKKYEKLAKKGLSQYERDLCAFMGNEENRGFAAMPPQCLSIPVFQKFKSNPRDLAAMALCSIPWAVVYCAIIAVINGILSQGTVFFFGVPVAFGLIPALLSGVFTYCVFQKRCLMLTGRTREIPYFEMCDHRPGIRRFAAVFLAVVLAGCLGLSIALALMCDRYYEDHAKVYREGEPNRSFGYEEITQVYYMEGRYNDYGDLIPRPSYVCCSGMEPRWIWTAAPVWRIRRFWCNRCCRIYPLSKSNPTGIFRNNIKMPEQTGFCSGKIEFLSRGVVTEDSPAAVPPGSTPPPEAASVRDDCGI